MTTNYRRCCKPQVNARFVNQELVEVYYQHFGFRCEVRQEHIDPATYTPKITKVAPREPVTPSKRDRDWDFGSMAKPHQKEQGLRGKRQFTGDRRSKANSR